MQAFLPGFVLIVLLVPVAYLFTQLDPLTRLPRRVSHLLAELEQGGLKIGVVPTGIVLIETADNSLERIAAARASWRRI